MIGLLSGTLKTHPVGWLTIAGFESLDPGGIRHRLPGAEQVADWMTRRFRAVAREWRR